MQAQHLNNEAALDKMIDVVMDIIERPHAALKARQANAVRDS